MTNMEEQLNDNNAILKKEANERKLMEKTKQELVGFILRKDLVEMNLMKNVSNCQKQIKEQEDEIAEYKNTLNKLNERNNDYMRLNELLSEDNVYWKELHNNYLIKLKKANKRITIYKIFSFVMVALAIIELFVLLF